MKKLLPFLALLFASPLGAANIYVDNRVNCPGTGTSTNPYCSIQNAFNVVNAGDHIKIRTGTGDYTETPKLTRSGRAGSLIVIESDSGNSPNIYGNSSQAGMTISASYVSIQNLKFDAGSNWSRYGIIVTPVGSSGPDVTNVTITGCTID